MNSGTTGAGAGSRVLGTTLVAGSPASSMKSPCRSATPGGAGVGSIVSPLTVSADGFLAGVGSAGGGGISTAGTTLDDATVSVAGSDTTTLREGDQVCCVMLCSRRVRLKRRGRGGGSVQKWRYPDFEKAGLESGGT